jgi:hypothetical protein
MILTNEEKSELLRLLALASPETSWLDPKNAAARKTIFDKIKSAEIKERSS